MVKEEIETKYKKEAQEFIDSLFDKGYFSTEIQRKDMRAVEELLAYYFQSNVNMAIKGYELLRSIKLTTK